MVLAAAAKHHQPLESTAYLEDDAAPDDRNNPLAMEDTRRTAKEVGAKSQRQREGQKENLHEFEMKRPPYVHAMLAGGLGGTMGDMLMHSLDTVKTRQQGDPHIPPKYTSMGSSYWTILRQEGIRRGLYGGVLPAFLGSFSGTVVFFGTYEWSKRWLLDASVPPSLAYLSGGFIADLAASPLYVPSEVLKTRLQLQGRYNNPFFASGYNYRSTLHAFNSIIKHEGWAALFYGYKATLFRDLPFSALQFAFWEQEQKIAKRWCGGQEIGLVLEIFTGASAGGMAGIITCPLDVVKTRIQTQHNPQEAMGMPPLSENAAPHQANTPPLKGAKPPKKHSTHQTGTTSTSKSAELKRPISTSSPSTSLRPHSAALLDTSSVMTGLKIIYKTEGVMGLFRGVGPRAVWTSVQSGTMLVMYQALLRYFERHPLVETGDLAQSVYAAR